jgi:tetratricopeptide (TPR) repeat protein
MMLVNQAIDVNSNNPLAWQLLGNCFKKMGRDQDALTAYDQAIRLLSVAKETAIAPANINSGNINPNPNNYNNPNNSPQVFIQPTNQSMNQSTSDIVQLWTERARTLDRLNRFQESVTAYDQALKIRCQEQALRTNEPLPTFCQPYLFPSPTTPNNSNRDAVIVPVSPSGSSQSPTQSKPNRSIW